MIAIAGDAAVRSAASRPLRPAGPRWSRSAGLALRGAAALCAAACAGDAPPPTVLSSSAAHGTLVLLPLNVTAVMPEDLAASSPVVFEALEDHLRAHAAGLKTVSFPSARKLWLDSIREVRSGERGAAAGFDDAARVFVRRLAASARFDAVVVPTLFVQRATLEGAHAHWDGVQRALDAEIGNRRTQLPADAPIEGAVRAASLHAVVLDAEGNKLQERQAGLALLDRARVLESETADGEIRYALIPIAAPFADRDGVRAGVARALAPFLPERVPTP